MSEISLWVSILVSMGNLFKPIWRQIGWIKKRSSLLYINVLIKYVYNCIKFRIKIINKLKFVYNFNSSKLQMPSLFTVVFDNQPYQQWLLHTPMRCSIQAGAILRNVVVRLCLFLTNSHHVWPLAHSLINIKIKDQFFNYPFSHLAYLPFFCRCLRTNTVWVSARCLHSTQVQRSGDGRLCLSGKLTEKRTTTANESALFTILSTELKTQLNSNNNKSEEIHNKPRFSIFFWSLQFNPSSGQQSGPGAGCGRNFM